MSNKASAFPSKRFFVEMLTRDIELGDAILDLVDNCIDGVLRQLAKRGVPSDADKPYAGYWAKIDINKESFGLLDNCGGIPRSVAEKYAFRMGRPADEADEKLPTVGVYGIGMKRALFKIGRSAKVTSRNDGKAYSVLIDKKWMADDNDWELPIKDVPPGPLPRPMQAVPDGGTLIEVGMLLPAVSEQFDVQSTTFIGDLAGIIATHYSYILLKGFTIEINAKAVEPRSLNILLSPQGSQNRIEPFAYSATHKAVQVDLIVGLYRPIPSEEEIEGELGGQAMAGSKETCGWTVICNDRVVLYNDKSRLTGWGEAGVPAYHPQFNAIAGVVRFRSTSMQSLPVTTTKRGLEASSELYLAVKDQMREGLKLFTNFTNHWKGHIEERDNLVARAEPSEPFAAAARLDTRFWSSVQRGLGGRRYVPKLPRPPAQARADAVIRFSRKASDVATVAEYLSTPDATPAEVGAACFDRYLERAKL
jgi:hypothetical protein